MFDPAKPEVSYLIGLLQTDGSHSGSLAGKGKVQLELSARDADVLPRVAAILPCYSSIRQRTRSTNYSEDYTSAVLGFFNQAARRAIAELGVPPGKKSKILTPLEPPFSKADYVRGLLDGDGSIGFTSKGEPFVSFVTASMAMAAFFCEVVAEVCGVVRNPRPNKRDGVMNILVVNMPAVKLAAWAWHAPTAIGIDRKRLAAAQVALWRPPPEKAGRYGVVRRPWNAEEDLIVREHSVAEAAVLLGRTEKSINIRRWRLSKIANAAALLEGFD